MQPNIKNTEQLIDKDGIRFGLPPNSVTSIRLLIEVIKCRYLRIYSIFFKNLKLGWYFSKRGLEREAKRLGDLLEQDLNSIDLYIEFWHKNHKRLLTDWEGNPIL